MNSNTALFPFLLVAVSACLPTSEGADPFTDVQGQTINVTRGEAPPEDVPGACYAEIAAPQVTRTVTEEVETVPAVRDADGTILQPPVFANREREEVVPDGPSTWFQTPCGLAEDRVLTRSVQRALAARALYDGPVSGEMDSATRAAIAAYQAPRGLDSEVLSTDAARFLGLAVWNPEAAARADIN